MNNRKQIRDYKSYNESMIAESQRKRQTLAQLDREHAVNHACQTFVREFQVIMDDMPDERKLEALMMSIGSLAKNLR